MNEMKFVSLTHHCEIYTHVGWPALQICILTQWYMFIYTSFCICSPHTCVSGWTVPSVHTEARKVAFQFTAPATWNRITKRTGNE